LHIKKCFPSAALAALLFFVAATPAAAQISLGSAQSFGVLAGSAVTSTGATTVSGNIGVSPGSTVTGFPPGLIVGGTIHSNDAVAVQAQSDLATAYAEIAGTACSVDLTGQNLGGLTLTPGVYCFSTSAQLTGALLLDALGNPNALFIFQIGSTLTSASGSSVTVINAGGGCNQVFWQVGSSATLGTGTSFAGDILALTSITLTTGADSTGRTLARNGAVTLDTSDVNTCGVLACPVITVNPATLPDGEVGVAYLELVSASGGTAPYLFAVSSGSLPSGLTLDPKSGALAGIPAAPGTFVFSITATDANGCSGTRVYSMTIAGPGCPAIQLDPTTLPPGRALEPYAESVTASGGAPPYTYAITGGALPLGYLLDPATGLISGVTTETGIFGFTVQATDSAGCIGSRLYSLTILEEIFGVVEVPALDGPALGMLVLLLALAGLVAMRR
jgi:hypothetical protein